MSMTREYAAMRLRDMASVAAIAARFLTEPPHSGISALPDGALDETLDEIQAIFRELETNGLEPEGEEH